MSFGVCICVLNTIIIQLKNPLKIVPTIIFAVTKKAKYVNPIKKARFESEFGVEIRKDI